MCGVFGFVSHDGGPVNPKILERIARATEDRGRHAWGMAWIDGKGTLRCYKQAGKISSALGLLRMAEEARYLIGHCRFATHGRPEDNLNNHPHPCDGGWLVHNGVIANYDSVVARFNLRPVSHCDSEVLGLRVEQESGEYLDRCVEAVLSVQRSPLVMLGLWKPVRVIAVRQANPLHLGTAARGYYLASLAEGLPGRVEMLRDNTAFEIGKEIEYVGVE
jgi:glucosamine 6-phosphate synthetase-like amidotransferase/phosphosugar isomerase protein